MAKVVDEWRLQDKYTILTLDEERPNKSYRKYVVDGVEYEPEIVYDMGKNVIGIKATGDFIGKTVEFM